MNSVMLSESPREHKGETGRAISQHSLSDSSRRGARPRLSQDQLLRLCGLLMRNSEDLGSNHGRWTHEAIKCLIHREFGVEYSVKYVPQILAKASQALIENRTIDPYYENPRVALYLGSAAAILSTLPPSSVDCIVTSPPYYGQRDYGVDGQIGLEPHPQLYIERLVEIFRVARRVLKKTGSLWVNLGDTYWSGKGRPHGSDSKQKHRRFLRPQDQSGPRPLCTPKQLLLIPHRFAIAMQDEGWIVRNDNVWYKVNPTPDPVKDRCASAHEYMFHFVLDRRYYFDHQAVAVPSTGDSETKAPPSVWKIQSAPTFKKHCAVFPQDLVQIPIRSSLPPRGILLDPFCGSGTALGLAVTLGAGRRAIGIDISSAALAEARELLDGIPND